MHDLLAPYLLLAACHAPPSPGAVVSEVPAYSVFDGADLILEIRGEPGPITSTAPPPPGGAVVTHPFLSAAARDAGYEAQLKGILDRSTSLDDFVARLRAEGYRVEAKR